MEIVLETGLKKHVADKHFWKAFKAPKAAGSQGDTGLPARKAPPPAYLDYRRAQRRRATKRNASRLANRPFERRPQEDAVMAVPTEVNVELAFLPRVVIAPMQTTMISASMTAYSTAVGPSSRVRNSTMK